MGKKKFLSMFLFILFVMFFGFTFENTCNAQAYYNITGENLQRIYGFAKQQSLDLFPQTLTTEYNNLVNRWNTLDTYLDYESIRWDYIADQLEFYLYNTYSGETATQYYGEDNLIVFFIPEYNNTISYNFYFMPYNWRMLKIVEETRTTSSGEVYFLHTLYENDINGSGVVYKNMGVFLRITTSGEYYFYNDLQSYWSGIQSAFGSTYKTTYSYYKNSLWTYGYGILGLYNNNSTLDLKQKQIFYRPPNTSGNVPYQIWYNMNVNTNYVATGDNFEEPTPTPTGDGGGGSSETDTLIEDINTSLTTIPGSGDFIFNSGDYISAFGYETISDPSHDFWTFLINGIHTALTNDVRYLEFDFLGETFILDNQAFSLPANSLLGQLLTTATIVGFIVVEFKMIHDLVVYISTLDLDKIFDRLHRMDVTDIFK